MVSWQTENANENAALSDEVYCTLLSSQLCKSIASGGQHISLFPSYHHALSMPYTPAWALKISARTPSISCCWCAASGWCQVCTNGRCLLVSVPCKLAGVEQSTAVSGRLATPLATTLYTSTSPYTQYSPYARDASPYSSHFFLSPSVISQYRRTSVLHETLWPVCSL